MGQNNAIKAEKDETPAALIGRTISGILKGDLFGSPAVLPKPVPGPEPGNFPEPKFGDFSKFDNQEMSDFAPKKSKSFTDKILGAIETVIKPYTDLIERRPFVGYAGAAVGAIAFGVGVIAAAGAIPAITAVAGVGIAAAGCVVGVSSVIGLIKRTSAVSSGPNA